MSPQTTKSFIKEFRNSFRRKKVVDPAPEEALDAVKQVEDLETTRLREMKESMGDNIPSMYTDAELMGFLRARSLNVKEAEKLVRLDETIRKFLNLENYQPCAEYYPYNCTGFIGFDKEGALIRVINVGGCDAKGIVNSICTNEIFKILMRLANFDMAKQEEENKRTGRKVRQFVYIANMEKFSMAQLTCKPAFDTAFQGVKLFQDHYHDLFKAIYFVNNPPFFGYAFKLFKPILQEFLQEKIKVYANWKEELLKVIDADVLPKSLGGNRVDVNGDPNCSEIILPGVPIIPENRYVSNILDANDPDVIKVTITAGATLNYRFPVRQMGSVLKYHIETTDNDLAIGVFLEPFQSGNETPRTRKRRDEDMSKFEQLTPVLRCQCHICPEAGSTVLWCTGNLVMHLDNSYSWMNSKDVIFKITITPPAEAEKKNIISSANFVTRTLSKITLSN